jgi:hypothetical protein
MEPTPLKRVLFWTTYVLGTAVLIFGLLLTQVPRGRHNKDFRLELAIWGSCFGLASRHEGRPGEAYYLFSLFGVGELCFCLYALLSIFI